MAMNKTILKAISCIVLSCVFVTAVPGTIALAVGTATEGVEAARGTGVPTNLANGDNSLVRRGIDIMLYAIGIVSVIMLIIGGFKYVVSGGQKESVTNAKNTILYAIVGLLIAIFSYAIVHFVISAAVGGGGSTTNI